MSDRLVEYLDKYNNSFDDAFPTIPLLVGRSEEEVIQMIELCLKENKDVIQMGYYKEDINILY
ncbi:MAG: hypothetical protein LUH02_01245 [Erysipelotrichaceae bacterium]|nr:hypothetical protein [Erysipelotrichaceae bacterium]